MPYIAHADAPQFHLHGASFTGLAAPSRGATENAVWIVTLPPGSDGVSHQLSREETFVALEGTATAQVGPDRYELTPGSALVVPAHTDFQLSNHSTAPFRTVAILPVGGQAKVGDGESFTPPWAA